MAQGRWRAYENTGETATSEGVYYDPLPKAYRKELHRRLWVVLLTRK